MLGQFCFGKIKKVVIGIKNISIYSCRTIPIRVDTFNLRVHCGLLAHSEKIHMSFIDLILKNGFFNFKKWFFAKVMSWTTSRVPT